jgi:hypothetical protein
MTSVLHVGLIKREPGQSSISGNLFLRPGRLKKTKRTGPETRIDALGGSLVDAWWLPIL